MREERIGVLRNSVTQGERIIFTFEDKDGKTTEASAFPPELPELTIGATYTYFVEFVSKGGKTYCNLARGGRDKPYLFQQVKGAPPSSAGATPTLTHDQKRELKMMRGGCLKSASNLVMGAIASGSITELNTAVKKTIEITRMLEEFTKKAGEKDDVKE